MRFVYHPAGHDDALRVALVELEAGRWRTARQLLVGTGTHWALRTSRTQALAVAAARSDVVGIWLHEEPHHHDAHLMDARVSVERALRAHRQQHSRTWEFEAEARHKAIAAARRAPYDPVPWVCLLALAQIDTHQRYHEHRIPAPELMMPTGPWELLDQVHRRDPYNREAYHRLVQFFLARTVPWAASQAAVFDLGRSLVSQQPLGSPLLLLPAYALVEQRRHAREDLLWRRQWAKAPMIDYTLNAFHHWFHQTSPLLRSVVDLSLLAYALWAGTKYREAAEVFTALGPYASREPWATVCERASGPDPGEALLLRAHGESLAYARRKARADPPS